MNVQSLRKAGIPELCISAAMGVLRDAADSGKIKDIDIAKMMQEIVLEPSKYLEDPLWGSLAKQIQEHEAQAVMEPIAYTTWGSEIDFGAHAQMKMACQLPMAFGAALMPDAHVGYGLPIGGVLALHEAVVPYAVGVDIACRMKLSILDMPVETLDTRFHQYKHAIDKGTRFGIGSTHEKPQDHSVLDEDWTITRVTRENKDRARKQLGTSGSGTHFVEFGVLTLDEKQPDIDLEPGKYVALLSHSGSRGTGATVCDTYSRIARLRLPKSLEQLDRLAWLDMKSEAGQEYWAAMNLMGEYAAANHEVIHRLVSKALGARILEGIENHHNFAWKEMHQGREVIVHRKGATPAGKGALGVIPGSMATPAFVVRGKGNPASFDSASHGAGRKMSRTQARQQFSFGTTKKRLEAQGVRILSAGADEVPDVYKDIHQVMREQEDLVEVLARFDPRIVKMSDDGKAED